MMPMLQRTIKSGVIALVLAASLPLIPRKLRKGMLGLCLAVMLYLTLYRGSHDLRQIKLLPFWSYRKWSALEIRWQIYRNIFLFIPYGALLKSLGAKHPIWIAMVTSMAIELLQLVFRLGMCETDDVINNTLGAAVGCVIFTVSDAIYQYIKNQNKSH